MSGAACEGSRHTIAICALQPKSAHAISPARTPAPPVTITDLPVKSYSLTSSLMFIVSPCLDLYRLESRDQPMDDEQRDKVHAP